MCDNGAAVGMLEGSGPGSRDNIAIGILEEGAPGLEGGVDVEMLEGSGPGSRDGTAVGMLLAPSFATGQGCISWSMRWISRRANVAWPTTHWESQELQTA